MKTRSFLLVVLAVWGATGAFAAGLEFEVVNDHTNLLYGVGEEATFTVTVRERGQQAYDSKVGAGKLGQQACDNKERLATKGMVDVVVDNFGPAVQASNRVDLAKGNPFTVKGKLAEPGFLRLKVSAKGDWRVWSVGYEPEKIRKGSPSPDDFDAFWSAARAKLAKEVPLDAKMTRVAERSTKDFDYYRVSFATFGRRIYGYLSVPTDRSRAPYPVEIEVSAAGFGAWTNNMGGEKDRIVAFFAVYPWAPCWNWDELGLKAAFNWMNEAYIRKYGCTSYCTAGISASREEYFFYPVLLGIDRAVDWIAARPDVDRKRFRYQGTSQGGGFGFYLTGLNRNFTRAAFIVPAITDTMGYLKGRQSGWPRIVESQAETNRPATVANAPYFDGANFASRITCPVRVAVGLADLTCAPCAVYAAFNEIRARDKGIVRGPGMTHDCFSDIRNDIFKWLRED